MWEKEGLAGQSREFWEKGEYRIVGEARDCGKNKKKGFWEKQGRVVYDREFWEEGENRMVREVRDCERNKRTEDSGGRGIVGEIRTEDCGRKEYWWFVAENSGRKVKTGLWKKQKDLGQSSVQRILGERRTFRSEDSERKLRTGLWEK